MTDRHIKQIKPNALRGSVAALIVSAIATTSLAQDTSGVLDWSQLDQTKSETAAKATDKTTAFKITECPVALFEDAYASTIDAANVHATAALELEVKRNCTLRQELAQKLTRNNRRLREDINIEAMRDQELQAFLAWRNMPDEERAAKRPAQTIAKATNHSAKPNTPLTPNPSSSFSNSNAIAEEEKALDVNEALPNSAPATDPTGDAASAAQTAPDRSANPPHNPILSQASDPAANPAGCAPEYLVERAGHQRGGDGEFVWATLRSPFAERFVVRAGDQLPGGLKIKTVSREVVLVTTREGATEQLAKAPEAAPEPTDAGFSYTLTKQDQAVNSGFILPRLEDLEQ